MTKSLIVQADAEPPKPPKPPKDDATYGKGVRAAKIRLQREVKSAKEAGLQVHIAYTQNGSTQWLWDADLDGMEIIITRSV